MLESFSEQMRRAAWRCYKHAHWRLRRRPGRHQVLFVFGCQRSGTTMLLDCFNRDVRTTAYGECSAISITSPQDESNLLRLRPIEEVTRIFTKCSTPMIVAKPLVESQRAGTLLDAFKDSKAIWVYRHYRDVANSNVNKFDSQVETLRILVQNVSNDWRSENVSSETKNTVSRCYSPEMPPADAAALFWYSRNRLFFELALDRDPRVMLCKYEDLVEYPNDVMRRIYTFAGMRHSARITQTINSGSVGRGCGLTLLPETERLCDTLLAQLDAVYGVSESVLPQTEQQRRHA